MSNSSRAWLVFLGLLTVIGYAAWWLAPTPPEPKPARIAAEPWVLPQVQKTQSGKALETLNKASLWGKLPEIETAKPLNDPEWRFVGIATNGSERFVLISVEGQAEQKLSINDTLPGGSKILKIQSDSLCILINGKRRSLGIYKMGPQVL